MKTPVFVLHTDNEEKIKAVHAFLKALNIAFEMSYLKYDPDFVTKIYQSEKEIKEGKGVEMDKKEIRKLLESDE
ncbi:MAG: hypothetical protein GXO27_01190 [Chlorobi bacterium]|nr:hypothetical protein [Chlorobiota bacterium]